MPTPRQEQHKLAAGHVTVAALASVDAITSWPLQNDMDSIFWAAPFQALPFERTLITPLLSGAVVATGQYRGAWTFDYLSFDMLGYIRSSIFNNALSAAVTVQTYDDTDTAQFFQCRAVFPTANRNTLTPRSGGWRATIEFQAGVEIE